MALMGTAELREKLAKCVHDRDVARVLVEYTRRNYYSPNVNHKVDGGMVRVYTDLDADPLSKGLTKV